MILNERETATVLAALRYWQREGLMSAGAELDIANDGGRFRPMRGEEIDQLCERLNLDDGGAAPSDLADVVRDALAFRADAFEGDEEVNGGDLVEWFSGWREQAKAAISAPDAAVKIFVVVEGGTIQSVFSGRDLVSTTVTVIDYDTDGAERNDLSMVEQVEYGSRVLNSLIEQPDTFSQASVFEWTISTAPIPQILEASESRFDEDFPEED